jgi:hypothetical protein
VYIGMPRSGRSPSKVVSCTFLLHELPAEGCLYSTYFLKVHLHQSSKIKSHKEVTKQ